MAEFTFDSAQLEAHLRTLNPRVERAIGAAFRYWEPRAVAYARQNAPWKDRTTNARNGLSANVSHVPRLWRMTVAHGVPYGIWLEVRWSGRYAIIKPTVAHVAPQLMVTARTLVGRVLSGG